jgi:hypothetical protein
MEEIIKEIKLSPIFNFSLSSKELFHSNFLFWLCKEPSTKNIVGSYFAQQLGWAHEYLELIMPERETENIDLMFELVYNDQQRKKIAIENKVKSLPYQEQLIQYAQNFSKENTGLILLSLSKPDFIENGCFRTPDGHIWHYLSYHKMLELLDKLVSQPSIQSYYQEIIIDYKRLILLLTTIENNCKVENNEYFNFSANEICTLLREKEVKLHDLYLKKKHEQFALNIFREIKKKNIRAANFGTPLKWNGVNLISVCYGMTRSEGFTDIKINIDNKFILGVQLQGIQYRLYAEFPNTAFDSSTTLKKLNEIGFFKFDEKTTNTVYPKKRDYNKFGSTFFYRYVRVNELKVYQVVEIVLKDIDQIFAIRENWLRAN